MKKILYWVFIWIAAEAAMFGIMFLLSGFQVVVTVIVFCLVSLVINWSIITGLLQYYKKIKPIDWHNGALWGWFIVVSVSIGILFAVLSYFHILPYISSSSPTF